MLHRHPSLRRLFFGALAIIGAPALLVAGAAYVGMTVTSDAFLELAEEVQGEMRAVKDAHIAIQDVQGALMLLPYDPTGEARRGLPALLERVDRLFATMREEAFDDPEEIHTLALAQEEWKALRPTLDLIPAADAVKVAAVSAVTLDDLRRLLEDVTLHIQHEIHKETAETLLMRDRLIAFVAMVLLIGIAAAIGGTVLLNRAVLGPLDRLRYATDRIGDGELGYRLEPERHLEFESVRRTFNWMASELAAQHQTLHARAIHDGLTGLYNREEFQRRLETEVDHARHLHHPVALLMIDLDHFKAINDTYGHLTGDQALVMAARAIRHVLRPSDIVARYGGEEFTVILPHSDGPSAERVAERILHQLHATEIRGPQGEVIRIAASIGVSACPEDTDQIDRLVEQSDQALYEAKRQGRGRIVRWSAGNGAAS